MMYAFTGSTQLHWLCKIHTCTCLEFDGNPSIGSNDNAITSYFCIHNEPHDLWPWPHDPDIWSVHCLSKIHTCPEFHGNLSICSNDNVITSYFCIHNEPCDLWPRYPPKSNHFIGSWKIHTWFKYLAWIHQSVLEIMRSQAVFAYIMSPVTFDSLTSWPQNIINPLTLQDTYMTKVWQESIYRFLI